jgi:hypothetical protein
MASSSPLQQVRLVRDHFDASVSILDAHEVLIPVELPERPAEAVSDPLRLSEFPTSSIETVEADFASLTRRRETSPGSPLESRHPGDLRDLSGSPQSDISRHSEDSVIIVGDIFAAPTGLKFSLEGIPNVKNAGGVLYSKLIDQYLTLVQHSIAMDVRLVNTPHPGKCKQPAKLITGR